MKNEILLELANRWVKEAKSPELSDGSPDAELSNAKAEGYRECKRECADTIKTLVSIFCDSE